MPAAELRAMTGLVYDQVRAVDSERIVLFGGSQWFGAHEVLGVWTNLEEVGGGFSRPRVKALVEASRRPRILWSPTGSRRL